MTLCELCKPIFDTMCRLHRAAGTGAPLELHGVRAEIEGVFTLARERTLGDQQLADQFSKVELPLMFFVDYLVKEGPFAFRGQWQELAYQRNELAGDEKFFDMLDETLADPSDAATERLGIYFTCMALGFDGCHASDPAQVERKVRVCALRIGVSPEAAFAPTLGQEARGVVDADSRFVKPTRGLGRLAAASVLILAAAVFANVRAFRSATAGLADDLKMIRTWISRPLAARDSAVPLSRRPAATQGATQPTGPTTRPASAPGKGAGR